MLATEDAIARTVADGTASRAGACTSAGLVDAGLARTEQCLSLDSPNGGLDRWSPRPSGSATSASPGASPDPPDAKRSTSPELAVEHAVLRRARPPPSGPSRRLNPATTTETGLRILAEWDQGHSPTGVEISETRWRRLVVVDPGRDSSTGFVLGSERGSGPSPVRSRCGSLTGARFAGRF